MGKWALAVDIGGSHLEIARISFDVDTLVMQKGLSLRADGDKSDASPESLFELICYLIEKFFDSPGSKDDCAGIGIAVPALIDQYTEKMICTNVPALEVLSDRRMSMYDRKLSTVIGERFGVPCTFISDSIGAARVECALGAARGHSMVGCFVLSTGVGGLVMRGGEVAIRELGQEPAPVFDDQGRMVGMERLELVANTAWFWSRRPYFEEPKLLAARARDGDLYAKNIFHYMGKSLGSVVAGINNTWHPTIFVFLGGISLADDLFFPSVCRQVERLKSPWAQIPILARAKFGLDAPIFGAAYAAFTGEGN